MAQPEYSPRVKVIESGYLDDGRHYTDTNIGRFVEPFPPNNNKPRYATVDLPVEFEIAAKYESSKATKRTNPPSSHKIRLD